MATYLFTRPDRHLRLGDLNSRSRELVPPGVELHIYLALALAHKDFEQRPTLNLPKARPP